MVLATTTNNESIKNCSKTSPLLSVAIFNVFKYQVSIEVSCGDGVA